jgi:hypothetical protein
MAIWGRFPGAADKGQIGLLNCCLRKDPKQRLRDIGDARMMLEEGEGDAPFSAPHPAKGSRLPWAVAASGVAIAMVSADLSWCRPEVDKSPGAVRFAIPFPPGSTLPIAGAATQWVPSSHPTRESKLRVPLERAVQSPQL